MENNQRYVPSSSDHEHSSPHISLITLVNNRNISNSNTDYNSNTDFTKPSDKEVNTASTSKPEEISNFPLDFSAKKLSSITFTTNDSVLEAYKDANNLTYRLPSNDDMLYKEEMDFSSGYNVHSLDAVAKKTNMRYNNVIPMTNYTYMDENCHDNIGATFPKHINPFSIESLISKTRDTSTANIMESKIM